MLLCARCGVTLVPPSYALSLKQKLKRLCRECRAATARESGRTAHTTHYSLVPTSLATQVIYGSALGDGGFERSSRSGPWLLSIKHGAEQHAYLRWKAAFLGPLARTPTPCEGTKLRVRTRTHPFFSEVRAQVFSEDIDVFYSFLQRLEPLAWAVFYLDDGTLTKRHRRRNGYIQPDTVRISCPSFSTQQRACIQRAIEKQFDVRATRCTWKNPRQPDAPYYGVRLYKNNAIRFIQAIDALIPETTGMRYKLLRPHLTTPIELLRDDASDTMCAQRRAS